MWLGRINEGSMLLTMQRESELASGSISDCAEGALYDLHFAFILQGRHKNAGSSAFLLRFNALLPAEYNAHLHQANVLFGLDGALRMIFDWALKASLLLNRNLKDKLYNSGLNIRF
jgi:hypothetical protein